MKIYQLDANKILDVQGEFECIGQEEGKLYVRATSLQEPFVESTLPLALANKELDSLKRAQKAKENEFNARCDTLLESFKCDVLGEEYIYDLGLEDQLNLLQAISSGNEGFIRCHKEGEPKTNRPHSATELKLVYECAMKHKNETIYRCGILKDYLLGLKSCEEVQNLRWEDFEQIQSKVLSEI